MRAAQCWLAAGGGEVAKNAEMMCHEARRQLGVYFGELRRHKQTEELKGELLTSTG
jgi:hypothetical protein